MGINISPGLEQAKCGPPDMALQLPASLTTGATLARREECCNPNISDGPHFIPTQPRAALPVWAFSF